MGAFTNLRIHSRIVIDYEKCYFGNMSIYYQLLQYQQYCFLSFTLLIDLSHFFCHNHNQVIEFFELRELSVRLAL